MRRKRECIICGELFYSDDDEDTCGICQNKDNEEYPSWPCDYVIDIGEISLYKTRCKLKSDGEFME